MQFPQYVVYTSHWGVIPLLPRPWVWYVSNPHHKANKIVAVHSVRFTSNTTHSARLRAGQAKERAALRSACACGNGSPCLSWSTWTPRCFSSRTRVTQGGQPILGPFFNVQLKLQLKSTSIKSKSLSDTNTVWVWLVESTIAMGDIYVSCMLCSTVMLTTLFHLSIIVYLIYKFFN